MPQMLNKNMLVKKRAATICHIPRCEKCTIIGSLMRLPSLRSSFILSGAFFAASSLLLCQTAQAHHGQEFMIVEDAELPHPGTGNVIVDTDFTRNGAEDSNSTVFSASYGLPYLKRTAVVAALSQSDENGAWQSESAFLSFQHALGELGPLSFSLSAGYQQAMVDATHTHVHIHEVVTDPGVDLGPDAPPPSPTPVTHVHGDSSSHEHSGLHNHGVDQWLLRCNVQAELGPSTNVIFNGIFVDAKGSPLATGYAFALSQKVSHTLALGLETIGDIGQKGEHLAMLAAYYQATDELFLKSGVGTGLNPQSPDLTLRLGVGWRF